MHPTQYLFVLQHLFPIPSVLPFVSPVPACPAAGHPGTHVLPGSVCLVCVTVRPAGQASGECLCCAQLGLTATGRAPPQVMHNSHRHAQSWASSHSFKEIPTALTGLGMPGCQAVTQTPAGLWLGTNNTSQLLMLLPLCHIPRHGLTLSPGST
jgi:hypothetical protein